MSVENNAQEGNNYALKKGALRHPFTIRLKTVFTLANDGA